jgi:hypothetical protein
MKAAIIFVLGVVVTAIGALFALQGASIVRWPAESFMVGTRDWIEYGIAIAMSGLGLMLAARRIKQD